MIAPDALVRELMQYNFPAYPSVTSLPQPITLHSLKDFFYAIGFGWLLLVSLNGWGQLTTKLLRIQNLPASMACAVGIAITIVLGGVLNLAHALYLAVFFTLGVIGLISYVLFRSRRPHAYRWNDFWNSAPRLARIFLLGALLLLILRVAATVRLASFNVSDDSSAYLVLPQKMISVHHFAVDPFCDRRMISSVGGGYFLQGFVLAATPLAHIAMADRMLGLLLLAGALFEIGVSFGLTALQIALLELLAFCVPQETFNLTYIVLPIPLLLGMIWMIVNADEQESQQVWKYAILSGALGGAVISLKSTYLPMVGALALIPYLLLFLPGSCKKTVTLPLVAGIGSIFVLAAWMFAMKQTSDTYLFPILGRGLDYSRYAVVPVLHNQRTMRFFMKIVLQPTVLLFLAAIQVFAGIKKRNARLCFAVLVSSALAILAFNYKSGGDYIWRYNFPQFFTAVVVFYAAVISRLNTPLVSRHTQYMSYIAVFSMAGMIFYYDASGTNPRPFRQVITEAREYWPSLRAGLSAQPLESKLLRTQYKAAEAAIPDRATSIEHVAYPFLLNYKSKSIFLVDWTGSASPKPGWPYGSGAIQLAAYLTSNSVRYVVFDYSFATWEDAKSCQNLEKPQLFSPELYTLMWIEVVTDSQLFQLMDRYQALHDDGKIAVFDLAKPTGKLDERNVWNFDTPIDALCGAVMKRYLSPASTSNTN